MTPDVIQHLLSSWAVTQCLYEVSP